MLRCWVGLVRGLRGCVGVLGLLLVVLRVRLVLWRFVLVVGLFWLRGVGSIGRGF